MTNYYITKTRKAGCCCKVEEDISHYEFYTSDNSSKQVVTKEEFFQKYYKDGDTAFSENSLGKRTLCEVKESKNGEKFLQTVSNNTESDNLLNIDNI